MAEEVAFTNSSGSVLRVAGSASLSLVGCWVEAQGEDGVTLWVREEASASLTGGRLLSASRSHPTVWVADESKMEGEGVTFTNAVGLVLQPRDSASLLLLNCSVEAKGESGVALWPIHSAEAQLRGGHVRSAGWPHPAVWLGGESRLHAVEVDLTNTAGAALLVRQSSLLNLFRCNVQAPCGPEGALGASENSVVLLVECALVCLNGEAPVTYGDDPDLTISETTLNGRLTNAVMHREK